jgi:hypothetical protein
MVNTNKSLISDIQLDLLPFFKCHTLSFITRWAIMSTCMKVLYDLGFFSILKDIYFLSGFFMTLQLGIFFSYVFIHWINIYFQYTMGIFMVKKTIVIRNGNYRNNGKFFFQISTCAIKTNGKTLKFWINAY